MKLQMMPQSRGLTSGVLLVTFISATIALTALAGVPTCAPAPPGLVGWWAGEGNATDSAGANNGALHGGMSFAPGEAGQAFVFDGSSGYVEMPASAGLDVGAGAGLTFECWIKPAALADAQPVVEWNSGAQAGLHLWISQPLPYGAGAGSIYVNLIDTTGAFHTLSTAAGILNTSGFQHVALSYDKASGMVCLYYNGSLVALAWVGSFSPQTSFPLYLGKRISDAPFVAFQGLMDEASLYSRALTAAEIQAVYNADSAGKCPINQAPPCATPPAGLVSWWPGEGNASDVAGGNNGTLQGGVTFSPGAVGQAFNFNPASGNVVIPDSPSLRLTNQLTIEAWINARTPGGDYGIVSKVGGAGGNNGYQLALWGNKLQGLFNSPGTGWPSQQILSGSIISSGVWYHVAFTYDQSAMTLYCNGQPVATNVVGAHPIAVSSSNLRISGDDDPKAYFDGLIDEPAVYNRALSAAEIAAIYSVGSAGKCPPAPLTNCATPPAGLVSWWPGEGNANDAAGGNNGTVQGGATFAPGKVGRAFNVSPSGGIVVVPDSPSLRLTNQLTIESWVNARSFDSVTGCAILSKISIDSANNGYQFILVGNTIQGLFNSPGTSWPSQRIISAPILSTGVWYHVAFTYDQSAMKLYCNGQPVATNVIGAHAIATSTSDLRISGADNHCYFDGLIDEPAVYSRALSDAEIAAIYNAGSSGKCTTSPMLLNVNFASASPAKAGFAGTGQTSNDFWNVYYAPWQSFAGLSNLTMAAGTPTTVGLTVQNGAGHWAFTHPDLMYSSYCYSQDNGDIILTVTNLPSGQYDFYLYGHAGAAIANTVFQLLVGGADYGNWATSTNSDSLSTSFVEGAQYVVYRSVAVTNGGAPVTIKAHPGSSGYALLNGMQIATSLPSAPVISVQPASQVIPAGSAALFSVAAYGTPPMGYQWRKGGVVLSGATNPTLQLANTTTNDTGAYAVVVTNGFGAATSQVATLTVRIQTSLALLDVNFAAYSRVKLGFAGTGQTTNDFWNNYTAPFQPLASLSNLAMADGTPTTVGLTVQNGAGHYAFSYPDLMYNCYCYSQDNGDIILTVTNLPSGQYDFYLYGHAGAAIANTVFQLLVGGADYGNWATSTNSDSLSTNFVEGAQYVVYRSVAVTNGGAPVTIKAHPGSSGYAMLNGMQISSAAAVGQVQRAQLGTVVPSGSDGSTMQMGIQGAPSRVYVIQASTNLIDWETIGLGATDANGNVAFTDPSATNRPRRFYRAVGQ